MAKIVVGLGNPGVRYDNTPHNIGFEVVDELAKRLNASAWAAKDRFHALIAEGFAEGVGKVVLMKPTTFMNLSGRAVSGYLSKNEGLPGDVIVVCDDVSLDIGSIRLRERGRSAGQKGLQNILEALGTEEIPRLRVGIHPARGGKKIEDLSAYVLHKWWGVAREIATEVVDLSAEAIEGTFKLGFSKAMSRYNAQKIEIEPK